jgi:hypothetical protein
MPGRSLTIETLKTGLLGRFAVDGHLLTYEELGVVTALSGTNFDQHRFHDVLQRKRIPAHYGCRDEGAGRCVG